MIRIRLNSFTPLVLLLAAATCGGEAPLREGDPIDAALAGIDPNALQGHVTFLADDRLAGRRTGTLGYALAADYVGEQFAEIGLRPFGDGESYLGRVRLRRSTASAESSTMAVLANGSVESLTVGVDYVAGARSDQARGATEAPAVFVGFGVSAPRLGYDDYEGVDVRGKMVVVLRGSPASLAGDASAHYSSGRIKNQIAAEKGAVGIVTILPPTDERRGSWESAVASAGRGRTQWLGPEGAPPPEAALETATMSPAGGAKLFRNVAKTFADVLSASDVGRPGSFDLAVDLRITSQTEHSNLDGFNVIGLLPGSDAGEYLVVTAHLDHVGIGLVQDGDSIYNGAADNAAGVGSLIEVARALAGLPTPPRRSVLFVATTAEEEGLIGAHYLAANPITSLGRLIANINMDGNLMLYPMADIIAVGGEHTSLGAVVESAAQRVGLERQPDPMPEQNLFIRSDHYAFVLQGIPSVALMSGTTSSDPSIDGTSVLNDWIATTLHRPGDDANQAFNYDSGADYVRTAFLVAEHVANAEDPPRWIEGDFFGENLGSPETLGRNR